MSQFFASGSPNSRLHLTTSNDTNTGMGNPTNETIFHSSMPHVLITETYASGATYTDNGYWVGTIPDAIINYMSTAPNRVIITELTYNWEGNEYTKMIYGGAISTGAYSYQDRIIINQGPNQPVLISLGAAFASNITCSADINCDFGYFPAGSNMTTADNVFYGTGRKYGFQGSASGYGNLSIWGARSWKSYDSVDSSNGWPTGATNTPFPTDQLVAPSGLQRGFNRFYVKPTIPLINVTDPATNLSGLSSQLQYEYSTNSSAQTGSGQSRTYISAPLANTSGNNKSFTYAQGEPFTPVRVTWYVTNMDYTGGAYNLTNPFTGNGILLSPTNFMINGVGVMNTGIKFINALAPGLSLNRPDMTIIGANPYNNKLNTGSNSAMIGWAAGYGTNVGVIGGEGGWAGGVGFSIYSFQPSASWQVNTTVPSIGNQWGDVWSPSSNPLKAFASNYSSVNISSGIAQPTAGNSQVLASVNLDLNNSRGGAVVMTLRFNDNYWISASGPGGYNPTDDHFGGANSRVSMSQANPPVVHQMHMILNLPVNGVVPFYVVRCAGYSDSGGTAPPTGGLAWAYRQYKRCAFTYYIRNNGNGVADILVTFDGEAGVSATTQGKTQLPNMTITIQKLA